MAEKELWEELEDSHPIDQMEALVDWIQYLGSMHCHLALHDHSMAMSWVIKCLIVCILLEHREKEDSDEERRYGSIKRIMLILD